MDTDTTIKAIIGVTILLVAIVMIAIPILSSMEVTNTENNEPNGWATSQIKPGTYTAVARGYEIDGVNQGADAGNREWVLISDEITLYHHNSNRFFIIKYNDTGTMGTTASIDIAADGSWTMGSSSGQITAPLIRCADGDIPVYRNIEVHLNAQDTLTTAVETNQVSINGVNYSGYFTINGTVDSLRCVGAIVSDDRQSKFVIEDATATVQAEAVEKGYRLSANPMFTISFELNGTDYTTTTTANLHPIVAPLSYTDVDEDNTVIKIVDLAPLLMITGVIILTIGALVTRRL